VYNITELKRQLEKIKAITNEALIEEYIDGREFTVMVAASADGKSCKTFKPIEYQFLGE
jgi:D-alanine-D-alanine ligase